MNRLTKENYREDLFELQAIKKIKVDEYIKIGYYSQVNYNEDLWNKVKAIEDIEEGLGIDLVTLYNAVKQQKIWTKYDDEIDCCDNCDYMFLENFIYFYWDNGKHLVFKLKDYGKTWALTREELKDDINLH